MKHFVLTLAAMAVMGAQSATAQNKVVNLTAESTTMNVAAAPSFRPRLPAVVKKPSRNASMGRESARNSSVRSYQSPLFLL